MLIELDNIYSRIREIKDEEDLVVMDIRHELSIHPKNYFFNPKYKSGRWDGYIHFFDGRGNKFPTGLLPIVLKILNENHVKYTVKNNKERVLVGEPSIPEKIVLFDEEKGGITLRPYQYEAVKRCIEKKTGIINASTGSGKTEIAAGVIRLLFNLRKSGQTLLFFTHSKDIASQTVDRLKNRLHLDIGFVGGDTWDIKAINVVMIPTIAKHLIKPEKNKVNYTGEFKAVKLLKDIITLPVSKHDLLKLIDALQDRSSKVADDSIGILQSVIESKKGINSELKYIFNELKKYEDKSIGKAMNKYNQTMDLLNSAICLIVDECHRAKSKTFYDTLMKCPAYYRFGLSGSIDQRDESGFMRIRACIGDIIFKISNEYMIEHGYSAKPTIYLERIDQPDLSLVESWSSVYQYGIEENEYRNKKIVDRVVQKYKEGNMSLIIVNRVHHGKIIFDLLNKANIPSKFTHGSLSDEERQQVIDEMKSGKLRVLVATTIFDEGIDIKGINCVFLAAGGKSYRQVLQRVGRGLRKSESKKILEVYDYLDFTNPYLIKHTNERFNYYRNEKFKIKHAR